MRIWAIGDLHLSFGVEGKNMDLFGPEWEMHAHQIETAWRASVSPEDLVLIPGDISWAMRLEEAIVDLKWIDALPGTKLLLKGNHDFWWGSLKKVTDVLPPTIHLIQNNSFSWKGVAIGGARLWDSQEYSFESIIAFKENPKENKDHREMKIQNELNEKLFTKELERLERSLATLPSDAKVRIAMTHYPPIGLDLQPSRASSLLEKHGIALCVFGHLHSVKSQEALFGEARGVRYLLASSDYLRFQPLSLLKT